MHQCMLDHAKPGLMSLGDKKRRFFMIGRFGGGEPKKKTKKNTNDNLNMDTEKSQYPFF